MNNIKKLITRLLKGAFIGIGAIIPGLSGGTTAILCGVFEEILEATVNFFYTHKKIDQLHDATDYRCICSIIALSAPIEIFCSNFPVICKYIFSFISLISTFFFYKKT